MAKTGHQWRMSGLIWVVVGVVGMTEQQPGPAARPQGHRAGQPNNNQTATKQPAQWPCGRPQLVHRPWRPQQTTAGKREQADSIPTGRRGRGELPGPAEQSRTGNKLAAGHQRSTQHKAGNPAAAKQSKRGPEDGAASHREEGRTAYRSRGSNRNAALRSCGERWTATSCGEDLQRKGDLLRLMKLQPEATRTEGTGAGAATGGAKRSQLVCSSHIRGPAEPEGTCSGCRASDPAAAARSAAKGLIYS